MDEARARKMATTLTPQDVMQQIRYKEADLLSLRANKVPGERIERAEEEVELLKRVKSIQDDMDPSLLPKG